ncbi:MAG TPA: hypothetical protein VF412_01895 [Bdellovibrio sp.]|uniref:hypothetical protein n=1 Tax=Bdellovibrio sp. TaxID=28201 RepID=UPI002EE6DB61
MKRLVFLVFALFVAACGGNGGGTNNSIAVTPTDMGCLNGSTTCNTAAYGTYGNGWTTYNLPYGNVAYNYSTYFNQYGLCGCPVGYTPAYNGTMGLGCVSSQYLQPYFNTAIYMNFGGSAYGYGYGGAYGASINLPQVSNIPGAANQGTCARNVTQSCLINQAGSCGVGATCQQVIAGSGLGVCVNPAQVAQPYQPVYPGGYQTSYPVNYYNPGVGVYGNVYWHW